jgi:hypothetical protein
MHITVQLENLKGRDHLGDQGVDGSIILKLSLKQYGLTMWIGFIGLGIEASASENGDKPSGYTKGRQFLTSWSEKNFAPWS